MLIDSLDNFNLKFVWYGVTSDWSYRRDALSARRRREREHLRARSRAYQRPELDGSALLQHRPQAGRERVREARLHRRAARRCSAISRRGAPKFRYTPDANAGIARAVDRSGRS